MPVPAKFDHPDAALNALAKRLRVVEPDSADALAPTEVAGERVLAVPVVADQDSPAADVSAMDGYATRMADLSRPEEIEVWGACVPGKPPTELLPGTVMRIFTGAMIPQGCEAVIQREHTVESGKTIRWAGPAAAAAAGLNIRRGGENIRRGQLVLSPGKRLTAADQAALAAFGQSAAARMRPVRVRLITTGDEVLESGQSPQPWQLRNSNRAALEATLGKHPWIALHGHRHVGDDREQLARQIDDALRHCDAVVLTGGVSMGDHDYVPEVVVRLGGTVAFHRLPIRPGKPILGASGGQGQLVVGLPGNPVSATIGCVRFVMPLLAKMSGQTDWLAYHPAVRLEAAGDKQLPLWWYRPVRLTGDGIAQVVASRGSGDLVSLARSDGFVEIPPGETGPGPWPYWQW